MCTVDLLSWSFCTMMSVRLVSWFWCSWVTDWIMVLSVVGLVVRILFFKVMVSIGLMVLFVRMISVFAAKLW